MKQPFYKQFLRLRQNIQDRTKLFTFKKQKWQRFQQNLKKQLGSYYSSIDKNWKTNSFLGQCG